MKTKIADTPELRAAEAAWRKAGTKVVDAANRDASKRSLAILAGKADRAWSAVLRAMKPIA